MKNTIIKLSTMTIYQLPKTQYKMTCTERAWGGPRKDRSPVQHHRRTILLTFQKGTHSVCVSITPGQVNELSL